VRLLLTWSDRSSLDDAKSHRVRRPDADRGPLLRLLEQPESRRAYDVAWVLTTPPHEQVTSALVESMRRHVPKVELRVLPVDDPSDYEQIFRAVAPLCQRIPKDADVTTVLSAGTPQMQTIWVVLVKAGLLRARMVKVIPPAFVPRPHPRAIANVTLDIEGFPEIRALREEVVQLRARERARGEIVGSSALIQALMRRLARVATAQVPVLVTGETGTGKDLVARAIHEASTRATGPFLAENCGALPDGTLASELFGHEKGAFTGATGRRRGLFELAHQGTLFLDEIGEISPRVQVGLLRILERGKLRRVGGETEVNVDVRVVAATHRDLGRMVRDGTFREDLYYRLKGAELSVPPLRARMADLEALVVHFLDRTAGRRPMPTRAAWRALQRYPWPGNVRELRAEVSRWTVFCEGRVDVDDLSVEMRSASKADAARRRLETQTRESVHDDDRPRALAEVTSDVARQVVAATLARNDRNLARTARELGIDRNTLKRKLRAWGMYP
jgi:DNA-binding NtrC family response regulator